jgi:hypothetical protein
MVDELVNDELRRDDADKRHVVGHAEGRALPAFLYEPLNGRLVENRVVPQLRGGEQVVDVPGAGRGHKRAGPRRAVRLL